jgi:hydrogenase nickel incorporation protein HypA/HybF
MHELSLAQALAEQVEQIRTREHAASVVSITVEIGALSGVAREPFEFAFPLAVEGTPLAGATLKIEETPAEVTCDACGERSHPGLTDMRCMECGDQRVRITAGRDLLIRSVELSVA